MSDDRKHEDSISEAPTMQSGGPAARGSPDLPLRQIGGFRITGKLGEGGMGIVYEAEQESPRRRVALKVVRGGAFVDEVSQRMLRREGEALARLAHPNIAAIYEAGRTEDGQHYFTMELVSGRTLTEFVKDRLGGERPTTAQLRERLQLFATICQAVNYAHQRGVIHRDLKPSNLVVTEAGVVKILDFGLARITDTDAAAASVVTEMGTIKGTLPFMSPEQVRGQGGDIDSRTDVYSLGVILYQLLSGRYPYDTSGLSLIQAVRTISEEPPRALTTTSGGVSIAADLQTLTAKALEKEPERRYQSAGELADDVERYLSNQPILAHPPSTMYQLRKLVMRHTGRFVALGVIAALLVALMVTMIVQAGRVRNERDRATAEAAKSVAMNQFLLDALGGADPWGRGSRGVTLLDALHQSQAKAHAAFQSQPLVEASVLQTLGTTFGNLAEFAAADTALRAALDLRVAAAGRRSAEGAESLGALAALNLAWARYEDAEKYAREALDITREIHGAMSLETAVAMNNLATALSQEAQLEEAKALAEQSLRIIRERRGANRNAEAGRVDADKAEVDALFVLGAIARSEGDGETHERIGRERLALVRSRGQNVDVAGVLNDLATAQVTNGDLEGAERTYLESIEIARAVLGDDHPQVATFRENLGNVYYRANKLDQTLSNLELVLAMRRKALGDDSEPVARTLANMAFIYRASGKNELAERTYRDAIERLDRQLGSEHPDVGYALSGLGDVLRREGKFAESESTLLHSLAILVKASGEDHAFTQGTLKRLVSLYTDWKKPALAAEYSARLTPQK